MNATGRIHLKSVAKLSNDWGPPLLGYEVFQAPVGIGEQLHRRAKLIVGFLLLLEGRLLRLEDRPVRSGSA